MNNPYAITARGSVKRHNYGCNLKKNTMKIFSLLPLLIVAFLLFMIGVSIPGTSKPLHIIFVVTGVIAGFIFYLLTFRDALTTPSLNKGQRLLWTVAIVCVPVIGNLLYVLIHGTVIKNQVPKYYS